MTSPSSSGGSRLERVLAEYLRAVEAGSPPDQQAFIAQHPDLADELRSYFANRTAVERLVAPLKGSADEPTVGLDASAPATSPPLVRYFGDYELLAELGRGGMGVVYKARQRSLNRPVALKMILAGQLASPEDVQRFRLEAEAAANLDHPQIAPIYETGEHDGRQYFSMKLIEGCSLREALPRLRADVRRGATLLAQVARAVHHAHQRGVLHRDLKPANILLDDRGAPYVTDFGLAKRVEGDSDVTKSGAIVGTPSYMAPEQAAGAKTLSTAVDVYSLGAVLYELLTGRPPFRADSPLETLLQVTTREPPRPRSLHPAADRDLETIALRCLAKDPARRYDSAAAVAEELERWLRGEPILARPAGTLERLRLWQKRNPVVAALAAAVAGLLVVGTVVSGSLAYLARLRAQEAVASAALAQLKAAEAEANWQRAVVAKRAADDHLYVAHLNLVQEAFEQFNLPRALELLDRHRPAPGEPDRRGFEWHYWHRQGHRFSHDLPHDGEQPVDVAFSPDGARVFTRAGDKLRVWDAASRQRMAERPLPATDVLMILSPGCDWLATVGYWRPVEVWDAATMTRQVELPVESTVAVFSRDGATLAVSPAKKQGNGRLAGDQLELWDWKNQRRLAVLVPELGSIQECVFSPDGKFLLASLHHGFAVWNLETHELASKTKVELPGRIALAPDGESFVSRGAEVGSLAFWNRRTLEKTAEWTGLAGSPTARLFTPDGTLLVTVGSDRTLTFWSVKTGAAVQSIRGFSPNKVAFSPDGQTLGMASYDDRLCRLWDVPQVLAGQRDEWPNHSLVEKQDKAYIRHSPIAFSPDGRLFASGGRDKRIRLLDVASEQPIKTFEGLPASPAELEFSPDGKSLAVSFSPSIVFGHARIYDLASGASRDLPLKAKNIMTFLSWSPDGGRLAVGHLLGIDVLDVAAGKVVESLDRANFGPFAYAPDRKTFAVVSKQSLEYSLELRDPDRVTQGKSLFRSRDEVASLAFSPDGRLLAAGTGMSIRVWDVGTEREVAVLAGHGHRCVSLAFSPDGRTLASASLDQTIKLWHLAAAESVATFQEADRTPNQVVFSPDGKLMVVSFVDGLIRLWRAE